MKKNKTDNAEMMKKPGYENTRTILRAEILPTRQLEIITSKMNQLQQQVAARHNEGKFWTGSNSLPIDGALFVGESGAGKSFGIRYATSTLPPIVLLNGKEITSNPIYVDTPTQGTAGALAKAIIFAADGADMREPKDRDAPTKAIAAFGRHGFSMVAIDEISRIINTQRHFGRGLAVQSQLVWTMAIAALNLPASPTPIVMGGLPSVIDSFHIRDKRDEEVKLRREAQRRMKVVVLPDLDLTLDGEMLIRAIVTYCAIARVESALTVDDHIVPRLIHASFRQVGSALEWIQKAVALAAMRPNGKLQRSDFAYVYGDMTSAADGANPFIATQWDRLNIGKIAPRSFSEAVGKEKAA